MELVVFPGPDVWNERLPNAAGVAQAHDVAASVPVVERSDDADPGGVGRPHGKTDPLDAVHGEGVRAEFVIGAIVPSLGEKANVQIAEEGREPVGIFDVHRAVLRLDAQPVGKGFAPPSRPTGKKPRAVDARQFARTFSRPGVENVHAGGPGKKDPHGQDSVAQDVHAEKRENVGMVSGNDGRDARRFPGDTHDRAAPRSSSRRTPSTGMRNQSGRLAAS